MHAGITRFKLEAAEEKEPKNFCDLEPGPLQHPGASVTKVFCAAFFQKSGCFLCVLRAV
jgi:hypothetical protein